MRKNATVGDSLPSEVLKKLMEARGRLPEPPPELPRTSPPLPYVVGDMEQAGYSREDARKGRKKK